VTPTFKCVSVDILKPYEYITPVLRMEKAETITVRITPTMRRLLQRAVEMNTHLNESELIREAIRKELERRGLIKLEVSR